MHQVTNFKCSQHTLANDRLRESRSTRITQHITGFQ
jgi:hypothetical protein